MSTAKVTSKSRFATYRGFLTDLSGKDPDALVDELRGDA
jgi:hypothetical protein